MSAERTKDPAAAAKKAAKRLYAAGAELNLAVREAKAAGVTVVISVDKNLDTGEANEILFEGVEAKLKL